MKKEQLETIIADIRRQHESDLESLISYIEGAVPIDEDTILEAPIKS